MKMAFFPGHVCQNQSAALFKITAAEVVVRVKANSKLIKTQNAVAGCNLKNYRMISVRFKGKPFNITVIQVYALTSNAEEAEIDWFYEDLQDLLD